MKRHGAKIRDAIEAVAKEARARFTEAMNAAVEEAISEVSDKSELCRRRDVEEAARFSEDQDRRKKIAGQGPMRRMKPPPLREVP